ncbi:uncharacterized protein DUF4129 [Rhodococcus wratislaviensis]|uniref:Protein-glutamine gamma-glutamyltransferase-like C-terminal domain-containing protein n=1 Tax=Rhodococcus wratislaviensis TaxID=44752 RepID=A0AB38FMI3_RHOWR|nr:MULTISPECIES: DUF4129 domain-containing protein [Rhodococcus]REE73947.1 uncharacterized protein DUF4129 [Rhodococcus wratislaviensis]WAM17735.1 DUF4129 domain-containing protein [Rhodococcus sp. JS3073]SPZ42627.1 Uncharacterised protein [Rhodococcus wratislaviensis]
MPDRRVRSRVVHTVALLAAVVTVTLAVRVAPAPDTPATPSEPGGGATRALVILSAIAVVVAAAALASALRSGRPRVAPDPPPAGPTGNTGSSVSRRHILGWAAFASLLVAAAFLLGSVGGDEPLDSQPSPASPAADDGADRTDESVPTETRPPPGIVDETREDLTELWTAAAIVGPVLVTVLILGAVARRPLRSRVGAWTAASSPDGPAASQSLARAAEEGLAVVVAPSLPPREAIIASYAAMEDALQGAPGAEPRESDTPSEVLARAVQLGALRFEAAAPLVRLFSEARFSLHPMGEQHRDEAADLLRRVLDDLERDACSPSR